MASAGKNNAESAQTGAAGARRVIVLGSTGSIGTQTLEVIDHLNALHARGEICQGFKVVGLAAGRNATLLCEQARRLGVQDVALADGDGAAGLEKLGPACRAGVGTGGAERLVREVECEVVVAAMVGASGLPATLAAVQLGRDVALANKETLVAAGCIIVPAARASGSRLLPVDSEHSAIWQCLQGHAGATGELSGGSGTGSPHPPMCCDESVRRLVLTASGGALRHLGRKEAYAATPQMALKHPTWTMGAKVTIDSASLTNKAFEIIEAHWLFGLPADRLAVLIHPQSIVHSLVEYADSSVIAQLGPPDMRLPIQYALTFPSRPEGIARRMDWAALSKLEFWQPEEGRYPALEAADAVMRLGGSLGAVFNGASEAATAAFLGADGAMPFGRIGELVDEAMTKLGAGRARSLDDILEADGRARRTVEELLQRG